MLTRSQFDAENFVTFFQNSSAKLASSLKLKFRLRYKMTRLQGMPVCSSDSQA